MRNLVGTAAVLMIATGAMAQTVNVSLTSAQDGQTVQAGATINWEISFTVSNGDNLGLALLSADFIQDPGNPETLDIPPADGVPLEMANFSRPLGISNPGEGGETTGYVGVQRGTAGALNLRQIGGGQNTFGQTLPAGTNLAQNDTAVGGVGQNGAVVLASGSFAAPATEGSYAFQIENVLANVIDTLNTPPAFSPVVQGNVAIAANQITFMVGAAGLVGDLNCDGNVSVGDINPFVLALTDPTAYAQQFPDCDILNGDCSGDQQVSVGDINCFVDLVTGG